MDGQQNLARKWLNVTVPVTIAGLLGVGGYMLANQNADNQNEVSAITGNDQLHAKTSKNITEAEAKYRELSALEKTEIDRQRAALKTYSQRSGMLTQIFGFNKTPQAFQPTIRRALLDEDVGCMSAIGEDLIVEKSDLDVNSFIDECMAAEKRLANYENQPVLAGAPQ
ncbi:MAG: hypothetical protein DYH13_03980 [Alphaproteobacteria bacterium PRO2]|nr:hypothetical protein [Alphaproteobacteria bacterium PRO2]